MDLGPRRWDLIDHEALGEPYFGCATDNSWPGSCLLEENVITSAQYTGNCFTLFHESTMKTTNVSKPSGMFQVPVLIGINTQTFLILIQFD